jgi:putative transposase
MSRFQRLAHVIWHCQYHIVFVPKYHFRVLNGEVGRFVYGRLITQCERLKCQVVELNVQSDHVHLLVRVPPKIAISHLMGALKGKVALQVFQKYPELRERRYWGNHFWAAGYCVDTVGIDSEMIQKYVKYQEKR